MTTPNSRHVGGKTFFWDGVVYPSRDEAATAQTAYEGDGFETFRAEGDGAHLVYTRRVVTQASDVKMN